MEVVGVGRGVGEGLAYAGALLPRVGAVFHLCHERRRGGPRGFREGADRQAQRRRRGRLWLAHRHIRRRGEAGGAVAAELHEAAYGAAGLEPLLQPRQLPPPVYKFRFHKYNTHPTQIFRQDADRGSGENLHGHLLIQNGYGNPRRICPQLRRALPPRL